MSNSSILENLKLSKVSINGIDVQKEHIYNIEIFESLMQPGITGYIDILDFQAIVELGHIFANDNLDLEFNVSSDNKKPLINKFKIYSNEGSKILPQHQYNVTRLGFCSDWLIDGLTKKVSKYYKNKFIHEIISDLLGECNAPIGFIEPTKQKLENFVTPYWTPYHSIKHLLSFTLSSSNSAGYLCWTDLSTGKVNVTSISYLYKGSLGKYKKFIINPGNVRYEGRILDSTIETNYDIIRLINNGLPITKVYGFNFDKGKVIETKESVNDINQVHLGKKLPINTKYTSKDYNGFRYTSLFPNGSNSIADNDDKILDLVNGSLMNEYTLLASDIFKINIMSPGEPGRRVGQLAEVDIPSQNLNAGQKEGNKQLKGDYLIRDIRHTFSFFSDYNQAITLVSDGYKEFNRTELINWSKK